MFKRVITLILFAFALTACSNSSQILESDIEITALTSKNIESEVTSETLTTSVPSRTDYIFTTVVRISSGNAEYVVARHPADEIYHLISNNMRLLGVISPEEHIVVPAFIDDYGTIEEIDLTRTSQIPNAKIFSVSEGIRSIRFDIGTSSLSNIEILEIPSTLESLTGNYDNSEFRLAFPLELTMLKAVHVEADEGHYIDEDGVLYKIQHKIDEEDRLLIVIPQNFSCEDQMVRLREDTVTIMNGAIYHCRNLKKVIIPDTVKKIEDHAIIATAEHPLTVVCSRNSVAAEYVERFGQMHHLTIEYTD